jgi:hypothetical protein
MAAAMAFFFRAHVHNKHSYCMKFPDEMSGPDITSLDLRFSDNSYLAAARPTAYCPVQLIREAGPKLTPAKEGTIRLIQKHSRP